MTFVYYFIKLYTNLKGLGNLLHSCFLMNLDFCYHALCILMKEFYFLFCLYFLYCFYTSNNKITLFYKWINITAIFICYYNSKGSIIGILPILLSSPFTSCSLINLGFYYCKPHSLMKALVFHFLSFQPLGFYFPYFFTLQTILLHCFINKLESLMNFLSHLKLFVNSLTV